MSRATYTARCVRSGDWWAIEVPEVPGVFSQARRLSQVDEAARDAIALMLEVPEDAFDVRIAPELPAEVAAALEAWRDARLRAAQGAEVVTATQAALARALEEVGLTVRDAGVIMGVTFQRAAQLLGTATAKKAPAAPTRSAAKRSGARSATKSSAPHTKRRALG